MFITPEFVFVHIPKTGGTFVVSTLEDLLCPNEKLRLIYKIRRKLNIKIPFFNYRYEVLKFGERGQHGWCNDIPQIELSKKIVSCIRNPYDLYVSEYKFGWWKKHLNETHHGVKSYFYDVDALKMKYKNILTLDFSQFLNATWEFNTWIRRTLQKYPGAKDMGIYTHRFVYFYCKNHDKVFRASNEPELFLEIVKENMFNVHFLRQARLNKDLHELLISQGYSNQKINYIINKKRINASRKNKEYNAFYNEKLKKRVREKEYLIFELFPEFKN